MLDYSTVVHYAGDKHKTTAVLQSSCDPGEARTLAPMIKSHLLYQLSYGVNSLSNSVAKVKRILKLTKSFAKKIKFFRRKFIK